MKQREKRLRELFSFFSLKDLLPNVLLNLFFGRKIRQRRRLRQKQYKPEKTAGKTNLLFSKTQIIKTIKKWARPPDLTENQRESQPRIQISPQ
jgi:hypothetical protein